MSGGDVKKESGRLPNIEVFPNQYKGYLITIIIHEFTSLCPRTGLPDFGKLKIRYMPNKHCVELKSLKYYLLGYRNLGIFYENAINQILGDFVKACKPVFAVVEGKFNIRGGMGSKVKAVYPNPVKNPQFWQKKFKVFASALEIKELML